MTPIMIIGGTDSSGGAGLTRDACVAHKLGYEVLPIVTAVTAQSHHKMSAAQIMPADMVARQVQAALASATPAAIKIGMLGNAEIAQVLARALGDLSCPIVIDPVLRSSSGGPLMSGQLPGSLLSLASLVTPNLIEAAALSGCTPDGTDAQMSRCAAWFLSQGAHAVLIKGGHATGHTAQDHLFTAAERHVFSAQRVNASLRGTGCTMATAIACHLAQNNDLYTACRNAKDLVHALLLDAKGA